MTLTKNQKMLLGVGALAVAGYMIYRNSRKTTSFVNFAARPKSRCKCSPNDYQIIPLPEGGAIYECCGDGIYGSQPGNTVPRLDCSATCTGGVPPTKFLTSPTL